MLTEPRGAENWAPPHGGPGGLGSGPFNEEVEAKVIAVVGEVS